MNEKVNKLSELLSYHETGMSRFQHDNLVTTRAGLTLYGMFKQSLRETYKRVRGVREMSCDMEKLQIEIEEQEFIWKNDADEFKRKYAEVEFKRKIMQVEEGERNYKDTLRTLNDFYSQSVYLKEQLVDLNEERIAELDSEMWEAKLKEMAAIDFVTTGRLSNNTYEFLHALPPNLKQKCLGQVKDVNNLVEEYENKEHIMIPEEIPQLKLEIPTFKALSAGVNIKEKE